MLEKNHYKTFLQTLDMLNAGNGILTLKRNPNTIKHLNRVNYILYNDVFRSMI